MKIGITGGIGSGKTYVATFLTKKGFPVYSCDDRARILMKEDEEINASSNNGCIEDLHFISEEFISEIFK